MKIVQEKAGSFVQYGPEHFKMSIRYIINLMKCKLHFCPQANAITRFKVTAISISINFSSEIFESVDPRMVSCCDIFLRAAGEYFADKFARKSNFSSIMSTIEIYQHDMEPVKWRDEQVFHTSVLRDIFRKECLISQRKEKPPAEMQHRHSSGFMAKHDLDPDCIKTEFMQKIASSLDPREYW